MSTLKRMMTLGLLLLSVAIFAFKHKPSTLPVAVQTQQASKKPYLVVRVVDGDTVDVSVEGATRRIRLIGINTPEIVDPRKPVECFGREASNQTKKLLDGVRVLLESDSSQGDQDKYGRLLRYLVLPDGTNINKKLVAEGYAYEYTYKTPYKYQSEFMSAQKQAEAEKKGLWGDVCRGVQSAVISKPTTTVTGANGCAIKGNINSKKQKIYHVSGCDTYAKTSIDESAGERWFCTEPEAVTAGWRKALNC